MDMTMSAGSDVQATRREWIGLAVLALPTLLLSVDISVLYLALPHLSKDLNANSTEQLWIIDIYSFMTSGLLVTMGTLGDRIGRRKLLLIGAVLFGAASIAAAYSTSPEMLILMRAVMGIAAATLLPSALALIRNMFKNPKQMGAAIGIWFSCFMGGMALGPIVGGFLLNSFWWGSAFLLSVPVMVVLLIAGPILLPEFRNPDAGKLDLLDVVLSLAAILPVIWGLKELARNGWSGAPIAAIIGGLIIGVVFLWRQGRVPAPLLDLGLFKSRIFSASLGVMLLAGVVMAGATLLSALYLQVVKGLSPLSAGLYLLPQNIAMVVGSMMAPALAQKLRPAYVMAIGLVVSAIGLGIVSQVDTTSSVWLLVAGLTVTSGGLALPMTQTGNLVLSSAPPEKAGGAAGIMEASGEFGVAVGVAVMGSLGTLVYRSQLPDSLPADVSRVASESITAAAALAARLGGAAGADLLAAARVAFTDGLNTVAGVGAVIFALLAVTSIAVLRNAKTPAPFMPGAEAAAMASGEAAESATAGSTTEA